MGCTSSEEFHDSLEEPKENDAKTRERSIMRRIILCLIAVAMMTTARSAASFPTREQDCSKCHTLKKEEAEVMLKTFNKNINVISVSRSKAKYLWEISYESEGKKGLVYVDLPKQHILSGTILDVRSRTNLTQEKMSEINRVNVSRIPVKDALVVGNKKATHKIIVFTDPECPFCAKLHEEIKKIAAERNDIAFYIKLFPLAMHPGAYEKAKAIVCEKSLKLLDDAFVKKPLPAATCKTTIVDETIKVAAQLGITGTPTMILPDGRVFPGFHDARTIKNWIDKK